MGDPHIAAIANKTAAYMYGLDVLVEHINDNTMNYTRFFIIAADMEQSPDADKITLVLTTQHRPGALYHVLGYFFYNGMNMTHLESRPLKGRPFEYFSTSTSWATCAIRRQPGSCETWQNTAIILKS